MSKASFKRKHTIKYKTFMLSCILCLVGPGLFILGTYYPTELTLFDTTEIKPVAHLDLQWNVRPNNVCLIPGEKVAVMCRRGNKIVIVSVKNNQLQQEHAIHIDCWPLCITSYKDDLFVVTLNKRTCHVSISSVTLTGDRHVVSLVCDMSERVMWNYSEQYSMTTSKESDPKIYVAYVQRSNVLEVSLDGSTLRSISMPHTKGYIKIMNVVSVGEYILCLFSAGKRLLLADIKSEKTSVVMKQKTKYWRYMYWRAWCALASVCPVTKTLLIWDRVKHKIKLFKWK